MKKAFSLKQRTGDNLLWLLAYLPLGLILLTPLVNFHIPFGPLSSKFFWLYFILLALLPAIVIVSFRNNYVLSFCDMMVGLLISYIIVQSLALNLDWSGNKKLLAFIDSGLLYFGVRQVTILANQRHRLLVTALLVIFILLTASVTAIFGILQKTGTINPINPAFPISGTFFHPAPFAGFLAIIFPLAFYCWYNLYRGKQSKHILSVVEWLSLAALVLTIFILPSTSSRAGMVSAAAGILFLVRDKLKLFFRSRVKDKARKTVLALLVFALLTVGVLIYLVRPSSANGRLLVWQITSKMMLHKPFFGYGLDEFRYVYPDFQIAYFNSGRATGQQVLLADEVFAPFNEPIQLACELGFTGLLLVILLVIYAFRLQKTAGPGEKNTLESFQQVVSSGAKGAAVSFILFSLFTYPLSLSELTIYFFIFLALANNTCSVAIKMPLQKNCRLFLRLVIFSAAILLLFESKKVSRQLTGYVKWEAVLQGNDTAKVNSTYRELFPVLSNNDNFLSDYSANLSARGRYDSAVNVLLLKRGKTFTELIRIAELYHKLKRPGLAGFYYSKAHFLLPYKFYPLYYRMMLANEQGDKPAAIAIAHEIMDKPVKIDSYDIQVIKKQAMAILGQGEPVTPLY